MKNKTPLLVLSTIACLGIGLTFGKYLDFKDSTNQIVRMPIDESVIARDINLYSKEAAAIVVGKVTKVGIPYLREDRGTTSQQEVEITAEEVLKGNIGANVKVLIEGGHSVVIEGDKKMIGSENNGDLFSLDEEVLIFIGTNGQNDYVVFAGEYGKYLIDDSGNVSSAGDFSMPLAELKAKIKEALGS
jgi:hypothetical protein